MPRDENPLGLFIPSQSIEYSDAPYLKPKGAERWIAELPSAHVGETARLIYKALAELNRVSIPVSHRFKILELFSNPLDYLTKSLLKHYLGQAFPLSAKTQKVAELTQELQWEVANGYKIIIDSAISSSSAKVENKTLLTSIYRAMHYLNETLLKSYLAYTPTSDQVWLELNHLYLFAEHNGLISEEVSDLQGAKPSTNTISNLFKQAILLSISNPYRLSQSDIQKVNQNLIEWSKHSYLHLLENVSMPLGLFSIDLEKGAAPTYYNASKQDNKVSKHSRVLDTSELTRALRDQMDAFNEPEIGVVNKPMFYTNELSQETLKRLILAWGAVPKRNFSRKGKKEDVKVALGLNAAHFFILKQIETQHDEANSEFIDSQIDYSDVAQFDLEPSKPKKLNEPKNAPLDVWDLAGNPNLGIHYELPSFNTLHVQATPALDNHQADQTFDTYNCVLINESAGGFCIAWDNDISTKTMIGALISLKHSSQEETEWNIGVIRWIKTSEPDNMYIGIELISPNTQPIATKNISQKNLAEIFNRSLLLPELRSVKQPQTLITPSQYKTGDKLELDVNGQNVKVKLTKLVERTSTFTQFQFSIVKTVKKVTSQGKMDRIKNFDSIWTSL